MEPADSLSDIAATGDRLATLKALRDRLALELDGTPPPRDVAVLVRQLSLVLADIDALAPVEEVSFLDRLASRNTDRLSASETA